MRLWYRFTGVGGNHFHEFVNSLLRSNGHKSRKVDISLFLFKMGITCCRDTWYNLRFNKSVSIENCMDYQSLSEILKSCVRSVL